jgi:hypothetical protein
MAFGDDGTPESDFDFPGHNKSFFTKIGKRALNQMTLPDRLCFLEVDSVFGTVGSALDGVICENRGHFCTAGKLKTNNKLSRMGWASDGKDNSRLGERVK